MVQGPLGIIDTDKILGRFRDGAKGVLPEVAANAVGGAVRDGMKGVLGGGLLSRLLRR